MGRRRGLQKAQPAPQRHREIKELLINQIEPVENTDERSVDQQGWVSWAWSCGPSITKMIAYDEEAGGVQ